MNYRLISPYVANSKHLPQSWRDYIDYSEDDSIMAHIDIDTNKEAEEEEVEEVRFNVYTVSFSKPCIKSLSF